MKLTYRPANFSTLMRLARQHPDVREFRLARSEYLQLAVKEPTTPSRPIRPDGAAPDWTPPVAEVPGWIQFNVDRPVRVRPDDGLRAGECEAT